MIFEVTPAHIEALNDTDLRTLIGYLAEREAVAAGHSAATVTYGGHQLAQDGGIDVRVAMVSGAISGFIPRLETGYQAKAEDFSAAKITKEMRPKGKLRDSIRELAEVGGAYIIVSSKGSVSHTSLKNRQKAMAAAVEGEPDAARLALDFYDKQRIATWVNQHPGLVPWVRERVGQPLSGWRPFEDWSSSPDAEGSQYLLDDGIRLIGANQKDEGLKAGEGIARLREILSKPKGVVRLVGLSGVGKTRLVQALFDDQVGTSPLDPHLAVYTDMGDNPDPVPAELLSKIQAERQRCILIVDNCGADLHGKLANRLSEGSSISLITVEYDISDDEPEKTAVFQLEPASKEVIENILKRRHPNLSGPEIRTISDFSDGNFRIALALANTSNNGQSLANLKDVELFNRLFRQKNEDNPALLRAAKICSLAYSFDVENLDGDLAELPILNALAGQSLLEFHSHVAELKRRQLIQARARWRALLPHALAHRLAKLALEDLPASDVHSFTQNAPERLLRSFSRRLGCLHDSEPAKKIVSEWLAPGGLLAEVEKLSPFGMTLLENVAPVNPAAALDALSRAATIEGFFDGNPKENELVKLLRSLAYDAPLFDRSIELIANFARSKTESNNMSDAINVFKSLFHVHLSGTHATPKQRANILRRLGTSSSEIDQELVLAGLDAMLECSHFSSSYNFEFGTRKRDYGYHPRTYGEQWDWYREAFLLAGDLAEIPAMRVRVRSMIASQFKFLAPRVRLDDLITVTERFIDDGGWPEGWAGVRGALRQARKEEIADSVRQLAELERKVAPKSLAQRIASYVLPAQWGALDLADDDFEDEKRYEKARKKIDEACEEIGAELANDLQALRHHLPELLASGSQNVFTLAKKLGERTVDPEAVWAVIESVVLADGRDDIVYAFPGAFLLGLSGRDPQSANRLLDRVLGHPGWHPFLPHMQTCVGLDKAGTARLIAVASSPTVPGWTLRNLAGGRATDDLEAADFEALLRAIALKPDGLDVAIEILYMRLYTLKSDNKPVSDAERTIARLVLSNITFEKKSRREPHMLSGIIRACLRRPDDEQLARALIDRLMNSLDEYNIYAWDYAEVISELAAAFPRAVLASMFERDEDEARSPRSLFRNFRETRPCPLRKIADDELVSWANEKPSTRFPTLAAAIHAWHGPEGRKNPDIIPKDENETGELRWTSTALRLIREAPDPVAVLEEFAEKFRPMSWSGSRAEIMRRREVLLEALSDDPDTRVRDWSVIAIATLREDVERARKWEAASDREEDERFDW